ncbi:MAG TPA: hypothetical protein VGP17_08740 [Solirubrobacteraceae bacterium]|nr:hypothetical protein [Solirubrobacteraceae bacterium]
MDTIGTDGGDEPTLTVRVDYQPKRHGFAIVITDIDPMPPTWGLLLGDIANNLRSALDQIAWAVVTRGSTPPDSLSKGQRRQIYFPISKHRDEFNAALPSKLPGATRADIARVRRYQPYHHPTRRRWSALLQLAEINASDKHRTVQPVWAIPIATDIEVTHQRDCVLTRDETTSKRKALQVNTELGFVRVRKTGPEPYIEVVPHLTAEPAFNEYTLLREWLKISIGWIQLLLYEFSELPDQIAGIGVDPPQLRKIVSWKSPQWG